MASYRLLEKTSFGSVHKCECCNTFQIFFGNVGLIRDQGQYLTLLKFLEQSLATGKDVTMFHTEDDDVVMLFTKKDIDEMLYLLQAGYAIFEAHALLAG